MWNVMGELTRAAIGDRMRAAEKDRRGALTYRARRDAGVPTSRRARRKAADPAARTQPWTANLG